jgi:colicin import membrane protein
MSTVNTQIAEALTFNLIKQTIAVLEKNGALSKPKEEVLLLFTAVRQAGKRTKLTAEERAAKKQTAAAKRAVVEERKAERIRKKQAAAEAKATKALEKEAKKLEVQNALKGKEATKIAKKQAAAEKKAAVATRKAERVAKKEAAVAAKATKAEAKKRTRLLKQLAKFAASDACLMEEMNGRSIAKMEGYLAQNIKAAADEKERKQALKELKAQNPRPKGRSPKGKGWCYETGAWIDTISVADTIMIC